MKWKRDEIELLIKCYPDKKVCMGVFPYREWDAVQRKARDLKLKKREYWSDEEKALLAEHYPDKASCMKAIPNREWRKILAMASKLGLAEYKAPNLSDEDKEFLRKNYFKMPTKQLMERFSDRPWTSVVAAANAIGLKRSGDNKRKFSAKRLAEGSHESFYWIGFLLADGHFTDKGSVMCTLSSNDLMHLEKLSRFLGDATISTRERKTNRGKIRSYSGLNMRDPDIILDLMKRLKISSRKTYTGVDASSLTEEQLTSMLVGFFDGDGAIQKGGKGSFYGSIRCHANWCPVFFEWKGRLNMSGSDPSVKNNGYVKWVLSGEQMRTLKNHALQHNLPVLERKWEKVVESKSNHLPDETVISIRNSEKSTKQICEEYGVSATAIRCIKRGESYKNIV